MSSRVRVGAAMSQTRVLHVIRRAGGGGIESFLGAMQGAMGDDVRMVLHVWESGIAYLSDEWPHFDPQEPIALTARARSLLRSVRDTAPDIVHFHAPEVFLLGAPVVRVSGSQARIINHVHAEVRSAGSRTPVGWLAARYAYRQCARVIACSRLVADQFIAANPAVRCPVSLLYNPVDTSVFLTSRGHSGFREQVGANPGDLLGAYLGRLGIGVKGLDVLSEAVRLLPNSLPLIVALIGLGDLEAVAEQLQPPPALRLTGPISREDVPKVLSEVDIYLHPARTEALGISIIEAMAAGVPVVATRVGGIPEAVEDGVTGLLVPPEDPQALADAIRWMIEHPAERAEMGRRGRERARLFDVHTIAQQLGTIYEEVLDG